LRTLAPATAVVVALMWGPVRAQVAQTSDSSLYLESDRELAGLLDAARKAAAKRQWRKALELYQRVADYHGKDGAQPLVPDGRDPDLFLPVQQVAAAEVARLPQEALRLYREIHDEAAEALYRLGLRSRDRQGLSAVGTRYLASSWGDDALAALGALAFERGDFVGALSAWERLVAFCPEPSVSVLSLEARMLMCRRALGQTRKAKVDERVHAGGSEMSIRELLASAPRPGEPRALSEWPMLAGTPAGARPGPPVAEVGEPLWRWQLANPQLSEREAATCRREGIPLPLNICPTTRGGMVFVADQTSVWALDAATGELRWAFPESVRPWLAGPFADTPHAVACDGELAVARLGDSVVALEAATGRVVWRRSFRPPEPHPEGQDEKDHSLGSKVRVLLTSPVVADGVVVLGLTELCEEARTSVVALDLGTGERLWRVFVCSRTIPAFLGLGGLPSAPAVEGSSVYFLSNLGVAAAIDLGSGAVRWVRRYPSQAAQLRRSSIARNRRWASNPPVVTHGLVLIAPQDGWQLLAIDAVDGSLCWAAPRAGARYLVGVTDGKVFAVGEEVAALDVLTGKRLWSVTLPGVAEGRPALSRDALLVPTERALLRVAISDGALAVERLWQDGEGAGNLALAGGQLVAATARDVLVFEDWAAQRKAIEKANEPSALLAHGLHEAHRGNREAAIPLLEKASGGGKAAEAREELFRCYLAVGRRGDEAALRKAAAVAREPERKAEALSALARLLEESGRPAKAVAAWQELLRAAPDAPCRLGGGIVVSGESLAAAEIARVVEEHGRRAWPDPKRDPLAAFANPEPAKGPPTERLWNVHTRIAHRRVEALEIAGAPHGLVFLAAQRRSFDRPSVFSWLECRRLATGELLWERELGGWDKLAVMAGGRLVLASPRQVVALDPASGEVAWSFATASADEPRPPTLRRAGMESYRVVALAADGGRVFVATSGGEIIGFGASDGKEAWRRRVATRVVLAGGLFVAGDWVWVVSESPAALFGLDPASGEPKGQIELGLPELGVRLPRVTDLPAFVPGKARLYLVVDDRTVYGLDLGSGRLLWRKPVEFGVSRVIASADGRRCFVIPEQYVHNAQILSLDPEKGAVVRRRSLLAATTATWWLRRWTPRV